MYNALSIPHRARQIDADRAASKGGRRYCAFRYGDQADTGLDGVPGNGMVFLGVKIAKCVYGYSLQGCIYFDMVIDG